MRSKPDESIGTRTARLALEPQGEPYWIVLEKGRSLGYRKGKRGGEWVARYYDAQARPTKRYKGLGSADDHADADGAGVLSYAQAQARARIWFGEVRAEILGERPPVREPVTVRRAVAEYLADRGRAGTKTARRMAWDFDAQILPQLGDVPLERLTRRRVEAWMDALAGQGRRIRGGKVAPAPATDRERAARRATANRLWTLLRAALSLAASTYQLTAPPWAGVGAFDGADRARVRWLPRAEWPVLEAACAREDFRRLVQGALATGARQGELARITAADFDPAAGAVWIAPGKTGQGRWIILESEAAGLFAACTAGLPSGARVFPRGVEGRPWLQSAAMRELLAACAAAGLEPITFHELRHSYASDLVNRGVPLVFVADQLGHASTRMVEKHYGHLSPSAKVRAIRGEPTPPASPPGAP